MSINQASPCCDKNNPCVCGNPDGKTKRVLGPLEKCPVDNSAFGQSLDLSGDGGPRLSFKPKTLAVTGDAQGSVTTQFIDAIENLIPKFKNIISRDEFYKHVDGVIFNLDDKSKAAAKQNLYTNPLSKFIHYTPEGALFSIEKSLCYTRYTVFGVSCTFNRNISKKDFDKVMSSATSEYRRAHISLLQDGQYFAEASSTSHRKSLLRLTEAHNAVILDMQEKLDKAVSDKDLRESLLNEVHIKLMEYERKSATVSKKINIKKPVTKVQKNKPSKKKKK